MVESELKEYIRSLVNEQTSKFWTDTDIRNYLKIAYIIVQAEFHPWLAKKGKTNTLLSITSGTRDYAPPENHHKITGIEETEYGQTLRYIEEDEYWKYADWDANASVAWMWKDDKIHLIPDTNYTSSTLIRVWYTTKKNQISDFPDCLHPLIAVEAVISAKTKDEDVTVDLLALRKRFHDIAYMDLCFTQMQEPDILPDSSLEDRYIGIQ